MIIAIDALAISRKSAGSFTVISGLLQELVKLCDYNFVIYTASNDIEDKLGSCGERISYVYSPFWARKFILRLFWQQLIFPRLVKKTGCRLLYSASGYPELFANLPVVSHQQNLWSFTEPEAWWPYKVRFKTFLRKMVAKSAVKTSKANVFISDYLRDCANKAVPDTRDKNFTVHNAIPDGLSAIGVPPANTMVKGEFCISVGSFAVHKNYTTLLRAFRIAVEKCKNLNLLIVGNHKSKCGREVQKLCGELHLEHRVTFCGPLDFKNVVWLYKKAMFSANVSLLEGFGLPVLESMALGCPVICSNCTSFAEIGDTAVC